MQPVVSWKARKPLSLSLLASLVKLYGNRKSHSWYGSRLLRFAFATRLYKALENLRNIPKLTRKHGCLNFSDVYIQIYMYLLLDVISNYILSCRWYTVVEIEWWVVRKIANTDICRIVKEKLVVGWNSNKILNSLIKIFILITLLMDNSLPSFQFFDNRLT